MEMPDMIKFAAAPMPPRTIATNSCRRSLVERLADTFREMAGSNEPITEEALALRDFPPHIVKRFGPAARELARRRWNKQG